MTSKAVYIECPRDEWPTQQYDWYRWRYVALWSMPILLLISVFVFLPWGIVILIPHNSTNHEYGNHPETGMAFVIYAPLTLLFVLWMRQAHRQQRFRAGMGFFEGVAGSWSDAAPNSIETMRASATRYRLAGKTPTMVGGAWSNVLRRETARGPRIHTRRLIGAVPGKPLTWYAGTESRDINRDLKSQGLQLVNVPVYGCIGAWVATQGHGMAGRAFNDDVITVSATVLDLKTGIETIDGPGKLMDKFGKGIERARQYAIISVSLDDSETLVPNVKVLRRCLWLHSVDDAKLVLSKDAIAACVFVSGCNTLGLVWTPHSGADVSESGWFMDARIMMFAAIGCGLSLPSRRRCDRTELLSDVPGFFYVYLCPVIIWFIMILAATNVEIYTSDLDLTPELLLKLCDDFRAIYKDYFGRCEIRFCGKITYFDLYVQSTSGAAAALQTLAANGVKRAAQHPGKHRWRPELYECVGIDLVNVYDVARAKPARRQVRA